MNRNADAAPLLKRINGLPLLRPWGVPRSLRQVCCVICHEHLGFLPRFCAAYPDLDIRMLMVPDLPEGAPRSFSLPGADHAREIPVRGVERLGTTPQWAKIFLVPDVVMLAAVCRLMAVYGGGMLYLDGFREPPFGRRPPLPDFFARHASRLQAVFDLLADEASRTTYAARIKALMTGDAGYLPLAPHGEYEHPRIRPRPGDIMIDGGVSDMVGAQIAFAGQVGPTGRIHGFEPIPWMADAARKTLAPWPCYRLHTAGLAERRGQAAFASLRDSSHICAADGGGTVRCELVSIDDVVREEGLERVDCIKLDVEGAELGALRGAEATIRRFRPRLVICLYHRPEDLMTLPLHVKSLVPEYRLEVAHASCDFTDTILYAEVPEA